MSDALDPCPDDEEMQLFVEGAGDQNRIRAHIDRCDACRELLAELGRRSRSVPPTEEIVGGRYRIVRRLGHGGMGEVFEAIRIDLGGRVALKRIRATALNDDARARFLVEAKALAAVVSPFVVRIVDFGARDDEEPWFAMEYLEGLSLRDRIDAHGPLEEDELRPLALQLLSGLEAAHAAGVLHRDVKPSNVVVQDGGAAGPVLKLIDFGLARARATEAAAPLTQPSDALGTMGYMAPEQLAGDPDLDARADLYSVGASLFAAATGLAPPVNPLPDEIERRLDEAPHPLAPPFKKAIVRAMRPHRGDRFADAATMAEALQPSESTSTVPTLREAAHSPSAQPAKTAAPPDEVPRKEKLPSGSIETRTLVSAPETTKKRTNKSEVLAWSLLAVLGLGGGAYAWSQRPPVVVPPAPVTSTTPPPSVTPSIETENVTPTSTIGSIPVASVDAASSSSEPVASSSSKPNKKRECEDGSAFADGKCEHGQWVCNAGLTMCDHRECVDTRRSANDCGKCGVRCRSDESCENGKCTVCPSGGVRCDGQCVRIDSDSWNCGGCGNRCQAQGLAVCWQGRCQAK